MKEEKYGNQKKAGVTILICIKEKSEIKNVERTKKTFIVVKRADDQEDTLTMALWASNNMALKYVRWEPKGLWVETDTPGTQVLRPST